MWVAVFVVCPRFPPFGLAASRRASGGLPPVGLGSFSVCGGLRPPVFPLTVERFPLTFAGVFGHFSCCRTLKPLILHKLKLRFPFTICHRFGGFRCQSVIYPRISFGVPSICSASIKFAPLPTDGEASATVGSVNPPSGIYMAIVNSNSIGAGRKSAGTLTYRRSRGRTIASQRILTNKSNTAPQKTQRFLFGYAGALAKFGRVALNLSYERTKYGSILNAWVKANWPMLKTSAENYRLTGRQLNALTPISFTEFIEENNGSIDFAHGSLSGSVSQPSAAVGDSYKAEIFEGDLERLSCTRIGYNPTTGAIQVASIASDAYATSGITATVDSVTGVITIQVSKESLTSGALTAGFVYYDVWKYAGKILTTRAYLSA